MKICAIICEYNPFHNGHLYQLNEARNRSGADAVLCLMSGNFVQRGDTAILEKRVRAKHAIKAGADVVIQLPTVFSTSNAELFAKGAIKLLSTIPAVTTLCFGAENDDKADFLNAAKLLNEEPKIVSDAIKEQTKNGASYAVARANAWKSFIPERLLSSPNNILGLEYTKAILSSSASINILPIRRVGGGYSDEALQTEFSSAGAIRKALREGKNTGKNLPDFVAADLPKQTEASLELLEKHAILACNSQELTHISDCTEGLENAFKRAAETSSPLVENLTSARYTSSRIRRIALHCLLKIDETLIRKSLRASLYLRILAAKKSRTDVLSALGEATAPVIARAHDENVLQGISKRCFETDLYADKLYGLLYPLSQREKNIFI